MARLEKRFKKARENPGIIVGGLSNEDAIWPKGKV